MSDHSPVPLNSKGRHIYDSKGEDVATVTSWWSVSRDGEREAPTAENAAFIVRACNAHDDLVEACEGSLALIRHLRESGVLQPGVTHTDDPPQRMTYAEKRIATALAKAKGE